MPRGSEFARWQQLQPDRPPFPMTTTTPAWRNVGTTQQMTPQTQIFRPHSVDLQSPEEFFVRHLTMARFDCRTALDKTQFSTSNFIPNSRKSARMSRLGVVGHWSKRSTARLRATESTCWANDTLSKLGDNRINCATCRNPLLFDLGR